MVDAHNSLPVPDALAMARAFEAYDIHFLEAPVALTEVRGQARVNRAGAIAVAGNESEAWAHRFRDLLLADAVHFVQFDASACGGITEGRRIAELARAFDRPCSLHAASSSILFAASLHLAAACANCESVEYHMLHQWLWDIEPPGAFEVRDGWVRPPAGPGLGLALTPDAIRA
jgi:L-alanine-DL-glutamate epimerase-like enolase superfamily enzyme